MRQSIIQNLKLPQCKLAVSKIQGAGIGVFALSEIPKDYPIFAPRGKTHFIKWSELSDISDSILDYVRYICHSNNEGFFIDRFLDQVDLSFYVNHSDSPNLIHNENADIYFAARNIKVGEELTVLYPLEERDWIN
jgi:SET domain-containing protein